MRNVIHRLAQIVLAAAATALGGCSSSGSNPSAVVAEGVVYSVEYQTEGGRTGGFTRLNEPKAVPGGNGSWNVDAYGKLTRVSQRQRVLKGYLPEF